MLTEAGGNLIHRKRKCPLCQNVRDCSQFLFKVLSFLSVPGYSLVCVSSFEDEGECGALLG